MKRIIIPIGLLILSADAFSHPHQLSEGEEDSHIEHSLDKQSPEKLPEELPEKLVEKTPEQLSEKPSEKLPKTELEKPEKEAVQSDQEETLTTEIMEADDFAERLEKRFKRHAMEIGFKVAGAKSAEKFFEQSSNMTKLDDISEVAESFEDLLAESGVISGLADIFVEFANDFDVDNSEDGIALHFEGKRLGRLKVDKKDGNSFALESFGRNMTIDKKIVEENGQTKTRIIIEVDSDEKPEYSSDAFEEEPRAEH